MRRRLRSCGIFAVAACALTALTNAADTAKAPPAREFPKVWMSGRGSDPACYPDLAAHGVQVIDRGDVSKARALGLKVSIGGGRITADDVTKLGLTPEYAVAIGGTYKDLGIDAHAFPFAPGKHAIEIFLPYFYAPYDARAKTYLVNNRTFGDYFDGWTPEMAFKAEVLVKQKDYDGAPHLTVVPAAIIARKKQSLMVEFSLTGAEGDLKNTMIAVYWRTTQLSPFAESTRRALAASIREGLDKLAKDNGGAFPADVVRGMRFGDECFLKTGFANSPKCSAPLYDYSESGVAAFRKLNPGDEYPRTWGLPEVYGVNAYRDWLYSFHTATAQLVKAVVSEVHAVAPGVYVYRNPTRFNPTNFATYPNDHDGCGTQLLAEQFDMINADPYPVFRTGDSQTDISDREKQPGYCESMIPLEYAYWTGLTKRLGKKFVPWLQMHTFSKDLMHVTPRDVHHMYEQAVKYNPDGIMWLGYNPRDTLYETYLGMTVPRVRPDTWKALGYVHERARRELGKPEPPRPVAIVRFYAERSLVDVERRELHDRFLTERILTALTMDLDVRYDVYEYYKREDLKCDQLRAYRRVVMCVRDLGGLPVAELIKKKIPLAVVCFDSASLCAHPEFTGVKELRRIAGEPRISGLPLKREIASGRAFGAVVQDPTAVIASAGDRACVWRHGAAVFASFIPDDPYDDGELMNRLLEPGNAAP